MRKKVSLVVIPIDDFTDKVIKDKSVDIKIIGLNMKPIKKQDGFFIFININEINVDLIISAYSFNTTKLIIDINKLDPMNPIIKVRLKPNDKYNFPTNTTCISGIGEPNTKIAIIHKCKNNVFKLFEDNKKKTSVLRIYNPLNIDLEGKNFIIAEKGSRAREKFNVVQFNEIQKEYILNTNLKKEYKKEVCEILKIDYIDIFDDGKFFFPLNNVTKEQNEVIIERNDKKKKIIELIEGNINDVNIME